MPSPIKEHLKSWSPGTYRIEVEGILDEKWSERLGGMRIDSRQRADGSTVTVLTGQLKDQAALMGILDGLYELHLPILSLANISEANSRDSKGQGEASM